MRCVHLFMMLAFTLLATTFAVLGQANEPPKQMPDIAETLVEEFANWYSNLGAAGAIPRAFSGVTEDWRQFIVVLTGIPIEERNRREFLIWLCRREAVIAYIYGTHVGIADDHSVPPTISEAVDLYASSANLNISLTMHLKRDADSKIIYSRSEIYKSTNFSEWYPFLNLQSVSNSIDSNEERTYEIVWQELRKKVLWRHL